MVALQALFQVFVAKWNLMNFQDVIYWGFDTCERKKMKEILFWGFWWREKLNTSSCLLEPEKPVFNSEHRKKIIKLFPVGNRVDTYCYFSYTIPYLLIIVCLDPSTFSGELCPCSAALHASHLWKLPSCSCLYCSVDSSSVRDSAGRGKQSWNERGGGVGRGETLIGQ